MLTAYTLADGALHKINVNRHTDLTQDMMWLDLMNPSEQERQWIKQIYGQDLRFIEELGEIEASARDYSDESGTHLNMYFLVLEENGYSRNVNVAFTISNKRLFTLRIDELPEFRTLYARACKDPGMCSSPHALLISIIATSVAMMADVYERLQTELEHLSAAVFRGGVNSMTRVLETLGRLEDANGKARLGFLENRRAYSNLSRSPEVGTLVETLNDVLRDVDSLMTYSSFLADRSEFLMEAAIGMINIAHSKRLNIFTVLSVILMPPMLVVSIYGMNFRHMPELDWIWGYPMALGLVLASAIAPLLYLKHKDWL